MAASETEEHRAPRRQWSLAEKRRIVELTLVAGASTRSIAIEQGVHPTSLSHWKSLYRAGKLDAQPTARVRPRVPSTTFMPVSIAPAVCASQRSTPGHDAHARSSVVQLMLASGATLRLETDGVDAALVCALVAELRR
jgi:transposase-like protein